MTVLRTPNKEKSHPWRVCPAGKHWVAPHPRRSSKSKKISIVDGHCRLNKSKKDQIYSSEMLIISEKYFEKVKERPANDNLDYKWLGNRYDSLIAGWTKYWNDILRPDVALDPNLVRLLLTINRT